MPSEKKRIRGDQIILVYPSDKYELIAKGVVDQTRSLGAEIKILMYAVNHEKEMVVIVKTSSGLDFRGEEKYKIKDFLPLSIDKIERKDQGLSDAIKELKTLDNFTEHINSYSKSVNIVKSEEGGYMSRDMTINPNFDTVKETKFGKGHRRVNPITDQKGKTIGFKFIPFKDYTPIWASDIFGYDTFQEALDNIYPYTVSDVKILEEIYMMRPITPPTMHMELTYWQQVAYKITEKPIPTGGIKQREYHWFTDFSGEKGKSMLTDFIEYMRGEDTIIVSSLGQIKDLIHSVKRPILLNSRVKNVVIDIPKQIIDTKRQNFGFHILDDAVNDGDIFKFAEMCANGRFTSLKYESCCFRVPQGGLNVIFFSNSLPFIPASSWSRWHLYIIKDMNDLIIENLTYPEDRPPITNMKETLDWYMSIPAFREYLKLQKISTNFYDNPKPRFCSGID